MIIDRERSEFIFPSRNDFQFETLTRVGDGQENPADKTDT